ncbi:EmtA family 23S rRNA (guanine(2470)) methyltransferase [Bacillus sp. SD088]|uniref:EmtA family 23S rRNA (guanine(2470)) methyltransferase n=1 Tax=Bacillus sp. SD088 TaxID=2782012 RepID=UPI001A966E54|nr:EmtA family 23S rRNA (guanine(2470)) methyltransferase [Bacillus sp. SD088]MBO0996060.1 EmtA family 23S rRNA (guanine(2470)) methyltransferase [Bacillus sp. SD088]
MALYFASVLPGLEYVLSDEITNKVHDSEIIQIDRGKVFFATFESFICLSSLRSADNIFQVIDQFQIGPHKKHLSQVSERISHLNLDFMEHKALFWVNASRKGKQTYSRFEVAANAVEGIHKRYPKWNIGTAQNHQVEFRLDIEHHYAVFSLRLTDTKFRFRNQTRSFSRASLLPTVAHAMVWLSDPKSTDIFVDPCCGSGTILSERATFPGSWIVGGDISASAIRIAKNNLTDTQVQVNVWDARRLPFSTGYVDKIVTNLPFGKQIAPDEDLALFNHHIMIEVSRILKANGRAVILSESADQLLWEAEQLGLDYLESYPISLKGLNPTLCVFEKQI